MRFVAKRLGRHLCAVTAASTLWAPQSHPQDESLMTLAVSESEPIREYIASVSPEYAHQVVPTPKPPGSPVDEYPELNLQWVEVVRSRLDDPRPPPAVVPIGLASLAWALQNPAEFWRILLPIPPEQTPQLTLPAHPRAQEIERALTDRSGS